MAAGGSLGPVIRPSIPTVIYASIAPMVSVTAPSVAGILPVILIGVGFMAVVVWRVLSLDLASSAVESAGTGGEGWGHTGRVALAARPALDVMSQQVVHPEESGRLE